MNRLEARVVWVVCCTMLTLGCEGSGDNNSLSPVDDAVTDESPLAADAAVSSGTAGDSQAQSNDRSDSDPSEPATNATADAASDQSAPDDASNQTPLDAGASGTSPDETPANTTDEGDDPASSNEEADDSPDSEISTPEDDGTLASDALGAFPFQDSVVTRGGTMTFTNVGAPGWWPRRIQREGDDSACNYKDGSDTWGGDCCMEEHHTSSSTLSPFDEEMTLIVKTIDIKQLAIYQPSQADAQAGWRRVSDWDSRSGQAHNLWFTQEGQGDASFPGDLTANDCVGYVMQEPLLDCEDFSDYYCPDDPGILHQGYAGSKLVVFLGSMAVDDAAVESCSGDGAGHPGPWVAMVASELVRDGGRKWNGACNCYSKTGSVGDGCGEINVFEVVMDDNQYSNREFASTGVRSYQAGHVGGSVCTVDCERDAFPDDVEVIDACTGAAYATGPELEMGGSTDGCPVWRRPDGDRYFFILFDEASRSIQVGVIHPANLPHSVGGVLPELGAQLERSDIDALLDLRLPAN